MNHKNFEKYVSNIVPINFLQKVILTDTCQRMSTFYLSTTYQVATKSDTETARNYATGLPFTPLIRILKMCLPNQVYGTHKHLATCVILNRMWKMDTLLMANGLEPIES